MGSRIHDANGSATHEALMAMVEACADGLMLIGSGGHIQVINRRFGQLWKLPQRLREDVLAGRTGASDAVVAHLLSQCVDSLRAARLLGLKPEGRSFRANGLARLHDGRSLWLSTTRHPLGRICTVRDFSDWGKRIDELELSVERLRYGIEASQDVAFDWDLETNLVYVSNSRGIQAMDELEKQIHPDDLPRCREAVRKHFEDNEPYDIVYRIRPEYLDSAHNRWVRARGHALRDASGKPVRLVGSATDFTDRRDVTEALERSEDRYRRVLAQAHEVLFETDAALCIRFLSPAWETHTGLRVEDCVDKDLASFLKGNDRRRFRHLVEGLRSMPAGSRISAEFQWRTAGGTFRWMQCTVYVESSAVGETTVFGGVILDVHDRRLAERERERSLSELESIHRARSEFVATVSHELRSPLAGIVNSCDLLERTPLSAQQSEYLRVAQTSSEHMMHVIDDLLETARAEAGQIVIQSAPFDAGEVVSSVVQGFRSVAAAKGLLLDLVLHRVPPKVIGDAGRVRQILVNLVSNACKFTTSGFVRVHLDMADNRDGNRALFRFLVEDSGIGVPAEKQKLIFEKFVRLNADQGRVAPGTGLGLAICRHLANLMSGSISVRSKSGRGSTFVFEAPFTFAEGDFASVPALSPGPAGSSGQVALLCVSDQNLVGTLIAATAESGLSAKHVRDASAMRSALRGNPPTALIAEASQLDMERMELLLAQADAGVRCALVTLGDSLPHLPNKVMRLERPLSLAGLRRFLGPHGASLAAARFGSPLADVECRAPARVLLVDDNRDNWFVLGSLLEDAGFEVEGAHSGAEALRKVLSRPYDLVFMDLEMPGMSGMEATRQIRHQAEALARPRTPIVALTAHALDRYRALCAEAGMDDFVVKPASRDSLVGVASRWIDPRPLVFVAGGNDAKARRWLEPLTVERRFRLMRDRTDGVSRQICSHPASLILLVARPSSKTVNAPIKLRSMAAELGIPLLAGLRSTADIAEMDWRGQGFAAAVGLDTALDTSKLASIAKDFHAARTTASRRQQSGEPRPNPRIAAILPAYLKRQREELTRMREALVAKDFPSIAYVAHNLKGTGSGYGMPALSHLGSLLESAARAENAAESERLLVRLAEVLEAASL